jgi:Peptidase family M23
MRRTDRGSSCGRRCRRTWVQALTASVVVTVLIAIPFPATAAPTLADCRNPKVPDRFRQHLVKAIRLSGNLPIAWADAPNIRRVICWQGSRFDTDFHDRGYKHRWLGVFAMTPEEVRTIAGPWLSNDRNELILNPKCFAQGWDACAHKTANTKMVQQLVAGLRWIWLMYGNPYGAWHNIVKTGRFNSYPRRHADVTPTRDPLRVCPVKRPVRYKDDFGERRTVGGYHPHWGNDIVAPKGRPIRAPFDGLAVAHSDNWFAGHYVTVTGREGYVRNGHLSRFGKLGRVKAGAIIGYVGETGDARNPHDHFEWHPWNVPRRLHRSPFGYRRIMDGVDPYPFLNKVCKG